MSKVKKAVRFGWTCNSRPKDCVLEANDEIKTYVICAHKSNCLNLDKDCRRVKVTVEFINKIPSRKARKVV